MDDANNAPETETVPNADTEKDLPDLAKAEQGQVAPFDYRDSEYFRRDTRQHAADAAAKALSGTNGGVTAKAVTALAAAIYQYIETGEVAQ